LLDSLRHNYRIVYDAGAHYPFDWFLMIPVVMFAIGLCVTFYLFRANGGTRSERLRRGFMVFWTSGAGLLTAGMLMDTHSKFIYYRDTLRCGRANIVEGVVTHFDPEPPEGHHEESFNVSGQHFHYSQYVLNSGFNQSRGAGGPMREGLQVRIAYIDGQILRLETAER
jgi:hypothetical protein